MRISRRRNCGEALPETTRPPAARLLLAGPLPPPLHGQSVVMSEMVTELSRHFPQVRIVDTGERGSSSWVQPIVKAWGSACTAFWSGAGPETVYIAVKAGKGMWLNAIAAGLARRAGARIFLHHHGYLYVQERQPRMVALSRAAGSSAHHIVLSSSMKNDLKAAMPEIDRILVLNNARWIDPSLLKLPLKSDGDELVLGHMSNLSVAKGIVEVVDLAVALKNTGNPTRLVLGGPAQHQDAIAQINRASHELGPLFEYRGPITGEKKPAFFNDVTHFVFPSHNEAVPLVLYEALAAGTICLTTKVGSIPEQMIESPAILANNPGSFVGEVLPRLISVPPTAEASRKARSAYVRALDDSEAQLAHLIELMIEG